jgi:hypothetical protein
MINIATMPNASYYITGPVGGFANHVRWLILLSPEFQFTVTPLKEPKFRNIVDTTKHLDFTTQDNKLTEFQNKIYSQDRSWYNWLIKEWDYRDELNTIIPLSHNEDAPAGSKILLITVDPDLAFRAYLKLNSHLNHRTPEEFKKELKNKDFTSFKNKINAKIISSTVLYQPTLDYNFYCELIAWFNLKNCYEQACLVHKMWFDCHERTKQEFITDINKIYNFP